MSAQPNDALFEFLPAAYRAELFALDTPRQIQDFLDRTPYSPEYANRSLVEVFRDRLAHCLDGGLFAAAALRRLGFPPLIVDMQPIPGQDDDHVLAIFKMNGRYGACAKSNFSGLRYREPVFRGIRELVMSYFEDYFNARGEKTLRYYTRPLNLAAHDSTGWMTRVEGVDWVEKRLMKMAKTPIVPNPESALFSSVDPLMFRAGMIETNPDGLYKLS